MMRLMMLSLACCALFSLVLTSTARAADVPLIPREVLFGNPERVGLTISPDGKQLAWRAPVDGVMNVWVAPVGDLAAAKPVTNDRSRGIRIYFWAYNSAQILYLQDKGGDENWRVYAVDLATGKERDLTPFDDVHAQIAGVSPRHPNEILVGLNNRVPQLHDLYRLDLASGELKLVLENEGFIGFYCDEDYQVRLAARFQPDGSLEVLKAGEEGFVPFAQVPAEDSLTTNVLGFDRSGKILYMLDSRGRNTAALTTTDLESGKSEVVFTDPRADVSDVMVHPTERTLQAVASTYLRTEWKVLDPAIREDFARLTGVARGEMEIISRSLDDRFWTVAYVQDAGPVAYYLYDRPAKKTTYLFSNRPALDGLPLQPMHAREIRARDGLTLVSYLTLPAGSDPDGVGRPKAPVPMVLFVHGGPWARDDWGFNSYHQWLANRGYAVLAVNFRGSTGFGKSFLNAGNREWAAKMHDDLLDAVDWAIAEKIADPKRVAIMGGSYGGYATLVGLTFTPERFAAGVDIVGPSNLVTLLESVPPYWAPMIAVFEQRMGEMKTEEGRAFLHSRSPLFKVDAIRRPLLIGQGANDPRVKQAESDQIVTAMKEKKIPVTYVLFPDEGHGFARPENNKAFNAITEAFLAEHLGGRFEPVDRDFAGSSVTVPEGAAAVPGLAAALKEMAK
ncbi:MAG TPA: S9 family peptidase [Thermoanaerobaculia bacterium]|nr:S9 family peptidase [Acidobacteriota bacterium]HNU82549.1 S9 family peptidase [Thermoanaerobaculia bacterium]HPA95047.1 S9 family peptidase [Thermoanaerobaculia bacterium]HQP93495.1 S9 family peptidase [Thermoanaerobaculia bacterium]HRR13189.1 S9 family peptidase [Thermoanaerobaculia bacterium]